MNERGRRGRQSSMRHPIKRRPRRSRFRVFLMVVQILAMLLFIGGLAVVGAAFYYASNRMPEGAEVGAYTPSQTTRILSSDGVVLAEMSQENRKFVPITKIPKHLQNGIVAIEDERFYSHVGIDLKGIARAAYQNLRRGRISQGASTITQQLARNIYLSPERKFTRKIQEAVLAIQLERHYSKQQILEFYLNEIYFGSGSYGAQTAARTYFGKDVRDLNLAQCALLAGLPQRPSVYSPYENPRAARARRDTVLDEMFAQGYINAQQRDTAKSEGVRLVGLKPRGLAEYKAPWFVVFVQKQLISDYGEDMIYRGGLTIYTSLDYRMQVAAERELRQGVSRAKRKNVTQGALICIDPHTGYIKAMVGGANPTFREDQFNRAVQAHRQPGSAFKAFVYTAAIDKGYGPFHRVSNRPIEYRGKPWPSNYSRSQTAGSYTLTQAVAQSVNRCAVNMAKEIGTGEVIRYARNMGIRSPLDPGLGLALGASVVTPLELCSAYGVFAADGMRTEPISIVKITESTGGPEAAVIKENKPNLQRVLSEQTARTMNEVFRAVVTSGTARQAGRIPHSHGKTGTTSDDRDAWFVGYTPELATAVWVGNDNYSEMRGAFGGGVCAPVWVGFMREALDIYAKEKNGESRVISAHEPVPQPTRPGEEAAVTTPERQPVQPVVQPERLVRICTDSGLRATRRCPASYTVPYDSQIGSLPYCTIHTRSTRRNVEEQPEQRPSEARDTLETTLQPERPAAPTRPPAAPRPVPAPRPAPVARYVTVQICVDSGQIANPYCPETIGRRFPVEDAPRRSCRTHHAPLR